MLEDRARRFLDGRRPDRDRLIRQISDLGAELADAATTYGIESAAWKLALEAEACRRAEAVQPKVEALIRALARSVERLSDDVEALRNLQAQVAEVGGVAALPDLGLELFGTLVEYNSPVSQWNRRVLQSRMLDP